MVGGFPLDRAILFQAAKKQRSIFRSSKSANPPDPIIERRLQHSSWPVLAFTVVLTKSLHDGCGLGNIQRGIVLGNRRGTMPQHGTSHVQASLTLQLQGALMP